PGAKTSGALYRLVLPTSRRSVPIVIVTVVVIAARGKDHGAGRLVENDLARILLTAIVEIEHVVEGAGNGVERATRLDALTVQPVVLDETQHRGLVGERVVDIVALGEWRDHQQRRAGAVAAAPPDRLAEIAVEHRCRRRLALLEAVRGVADPGP